MSAHDSALITALKQIITSFESAPSLTTQPVVSVPDASLTIKEFCAVERFSIPTFWKLTRMGLGPDVQRIPGMALKRITAKARADWHAKLDALNQEQAAVIETERLRRLNSKVKAAKLSAASEKHVSKRSKRRTMAAG